MVLGPAHDGREDSSWSVVTSETSLAHAGTIVAHERSYFLFFVAHSLIWSDSWLSFYFL
jgi:hypothetical protein